MPCTQCQLLYTTFDGMCREQPSSQGNPSPTSVEATLQQPSGQADTHAVTPQWTVEDFAWGRPRPSTGIAYNMPSQHAADTCTTSANGKTTQNAVHLAVCSSAKSVVSHRSAQQCYVSRHCQGCDATVLHYGLGHEKANWHCNGQQSPHIQHDQHSACRLKHAA